MGNPRCSKIARTPRACFTYANTLRLPPHLTQANTSKSNVFLRSSAQSTRGVLSFFGSFLAAASSATLVSPAPAAWGSIEIADPEALLEWLAKDRASVKFRDLKDIDARSSAFAKLIRQWLEHV